MFHVIELLAFFILLAASNAKFPENVTLVKTIILFRHGMRAPSKAFHLTGTFDEISKYWPNGYGELTENGKRQLFHLGQRLHNHYGNLVEPRSDNVAKYLQVVSTPVHRCYESALHLLAGFFSSIFHWTWSEAVEKQPVPILHNSPDGTSILANKNACPRYNELLNEVLPDINKPEMNFIRQYIMDHTNHVNITSLVDIFMFVDYIKMKTHMNLELPWWISDEFRKKLDAFFVESFHWLSVTPEMIRLFSGPLIKDVSVRIKEVISAKPTNNKMFFYAGHDTSLHVLSKLLGFQLDFVPYFGSSIIFEVYRVSPTDYRIRTLFNKDYTFDSIEVWRLPECDVLCPVGKFFQIIEKFIVQDWTSECSL